MPKSFVAETHKYVVAAGTRDWIDVYHHSKTEASSITVIAGLVPEPLVSQVLERESWAVEPSRLRPGCTKYGSGEVLYHRFGDDEGYEPLILERDFNGVKPSHEEVSEEFRLFHNLYFDSKNKKYIKIKDDGSEHEIIRMAEGRISIRAVEIKQFLAIKEMRLALFFDIRRLFPEPLKNYGLDYEVAKVAGGDFAYTCVVADNELRDGSLVRIYGKKLIGGFAKEDTDFWPYNENNEDEREYMEFIVGVDEKGRQIKLPCDPHGGHYLTPVFFRPELLNRYYENPSKYSVEDGYLRCAGLWGVQIDNDNPAYVTVLLGDIGRDLPESEHGYWRTFNIVPPGGMSETAFKRNFLAEFADPTRPDLLLKQEFTTFQLAWKDAQGWSLFKPLSEGDEHCFVSLRVPTTDEQNEFDNQVMYLTKVLVDSLNEAEIAKHIPFVPDQKGIGKLEAFLNVKNVPDREQHIQFLRDLQSLRSTGAAHRKSDNYEKAAKKLGLHERDSRVAFAELLNKAVAFLRDMRAVK